MRHLTNTFPLGLTLYVDGHYLTTTFLLDRSRSSVFFGLSAAPKSSHTDEYCYRDIACTLGARITDWEADVHGCSGLRISDSGRWQLPPVTFNPIRRVLHNDGHIRQTRPSSDLW